MFSFIVFYVTRSPVRDIQERCGGFVRAHCIIHITQWELLPTYMPGGITYPSLQARTTYIITPWRMHSNRSYTICRLCDMPMTNYVFYFRKGVCIFREVYAVRYCTTTWINSHTWQRCDGWDVSPSMHSGTCVVYTIELYQVHVFLMGYICVKKYYMTIRIYVHLPSRSVTSVKIKACTIYRYVWYSTTLS